LAFGKLFDPRLAIRSGWAPVDAAVLEGDPAAMAGRDLVFGSVPIRGLA
jgi:hypothetical protein